MVIFDPKKGACGNRPAGGKWFWSFLGQKKSACGKPPAEENGEKHENHYETVTFWTLRAGNRFKMVKNVKIGLKRVAV